MCRLFRFWFAGEAERWMIDLEEEEDSKPSNWTFDQWCWNLMDAFPEPLSDFF
jgi:hypothetical protein